MPNTNTYTPECTVCGDAYSQRRAALGYRTCLDCGETAAFEERQSWTIVVSAKGHYTRITDPEDLKELNKYASPESKRFPQP